MQITQTELASKIGATPRNVCNWEKGAYEPDFDMLVKIANFFDVSCDYLLGVEKNENSVPLSTQDRELLFKIKNLSDDKKNALIALLSD